MSKKKKTSKHQSYIIKVLRAARTEHEKIAVVFHKAGATSAYRTMAAAKKRIENLMVRVQRAKTTAQITAAATAAEALVVEAQQAIFDAVIVLGMTALGRRIKKTLRTLDLNHQFTWWYAHVEEEEANAAHAKQLAAEKQAQARAEKQALSGRAPATNGAYTPDAPIDLDIHVDVPTEVE